jgi:hypothetical protein
VRYDAPLTITQSSFTHNSANTGGGLFLTSSSDPGVTPYILVHDSTLSGNTSANPGGAVLNQDRVELYSVTLKDNSDGFYNLPAVGVDGRLRGSVLQNTGDNCTGQTPSDDSHNFATDDTCAFPTSHQGIVPSPRLGPLTSDPGGLTSFHLPLPGSPLINAGPSNCSPTDQRGALRPDACDIGAVDFGGLLPRLWLALQQR